MSRKPARRPVSSSGREHRIGEPGPSGAARQPSVADRLLVMQRTAGNQAVAALIRGDGPNQAKLARFDHGTYSLSGTMAVLTGSQSGISASASASLQRQEGPELPPVLPVLAITVFGREYSAIAHVNRRLPRLRGTTRARFTSTSTTPDLQTEPGTGCKKCKLPNCVHVTGTLVSTFTATTTVTLPTPPRRGFSECEREQIQNVIDTTLASHEEEHVTAFKEYEGTVETPLDLTLCRSKVPGAVQKMHNDEERKRRKHAKETSAALDPFNFNFTLEPCGE
jgi:hypothetical protein